MDVYRLGCWYSYTPDIEIEKEKINSALFTDR